MKSERRIKKMAYKVKHIKEVLWEGGSYMFSNREGNPYTLRFDKLIHEFYSEVYSFQNELYHDYVAPGKVRATVENIDGHTVFIYEGIVTARTGEKVTISKRIEMSGILTQKLPSSP